MKRIMGRLFSLFVRRATRAEVISFPSYGRFPRGQKAMGEGIWGQTESSPAFLSTQVNKPGSIPSVPTFSSSNFADSYRIQ